MLHNVKITPRKGSCVYDVQIDGKDIPGVDAINTHIQSGYLPSVRLGMMAIPDIEVCAEVSMSMDVDTIQTAIKCIQFNIRLDEDFRNGILTGIADVLQNEHDNLPEKIMNRVFGLD